MPWGLFLRASARHLIGSLRLEPPGDLCDCVNMTLAELLPDEDYRFQMRFKKGTVPEFFGPTDRNSEILAERRHWLDENPQQYAAMLPDGAELIRETVELARREETLPESNSDLFSQVLNPFELCMRLGKVWEPDFLLLRVDADDEVRLMGGCVCFPSSWNLAEKIGHPIQFIHNVVPGLNPALGSQIRGFLSRLKPGTVWLRANWGLSRSPDLNQHPARGLPRLSSNASLDETFLRIENQALVALPESRGV